MKNRSKTLKDKIENKNKWDSNDNIPNLEILKSLDIELLKSVDAVKSLLCMPKFQKAYWMDNGTMLGFVKASLALREAIVTWRQQQNYCEGECCL